MGVILASLPLCEKDIRDGRLVRLSDETMEHHESYWAIAGPDAIARSQWDELANVLT